MVAAGWWNNVDGDPLPPPTVPLLRDSAGKATGAKLAWQWSYRAAALPYRTCVQLCAAAHLSVRKTAGRPLQRRRRLDAQRARFAPHRRRRHSLRALPRRTFIIAMPAERRSGNQRHTFGLSVNGSKPLIVSRHPSQLNDFYRYKSETWSGNYQVFDGLSGDLTIAATPAGPGPLHDKFIAGFQIVETSQ